MESRTIQAAPSESKFYLHAMNNVVPTPAFLSKFIAVGVDPTCCLCHSASATLAHIVSNCQEALERYKWRHNEILRILHHEIGREVRRVCQKTPRPLERKDKMIFVKAGQAVSRRKREAKPSLLEQANDWHVTVDLPSVTYQFPHHIVVTQLRPDLVIWSDTLRVVVMLELTIPHERGLTDANKRKAEKYAALKQECTDRGWRVELLPVEMGVIWTCGPVYAKGMPYAGRLVEETARQFGGDSLEMFLCYICGSESFKLDIYVADVVAHLKSRRLEETGERRKEEG